MRYGQHADHPTLATLRWGLPNPDDYGPGPMAEANAQERAARDHDADVTAGEHCMVCCEDPDCLICNPV